MANLFDAANAPEGEPTKIVVGDFLQWKKEALASDYPTASHSAEYVARITAGGSSEIKIAATETNGYYLFTVASATSAAYTAGDYHWQLEVTQTSSGNRVVVEEGDFKILPDLDNDSADVRTHAEKMLALLEVIIETKAANGDVSSYSINGRSANKMSFAELREERDYYRSEVLREKRAELVKRGKASANTVKVRFI